MVGSSEEDRGPLFAIIYRPGPNWVDAKPLAEQDLRAHLSYIETLHAGGAVVSAGPFLDKKSGGVAIIRAKEEVAARAVMNADPAVTMGIFEAQLRPYRQIYGDLTSKPVNHEERAQVDRNLDTARSVFAVVGSRGNGANSQAQWKVYEAMYAPDVTIHEAPDLPYGGDYKGRDAVARHAQAYRAAWDTLRPPDEQSLEPQFFAAGDQVVVLWRQRGSTRGGECLDMPAVSVYRMEDGRIVDSRMFNFDTVAVSAFLESTTTGKA